MVFLSLSGEKTTKNRELWDFVSGLDRRDAAREGGKLKAADIWFAEPDRT